MLNKNKENNKDVNIQKKLTLITVRKTKDKTKDNKTISLTSKMWCKLIKTLPIYFHHGKVLLTTF
jgi:hypothetical protein